MGRVCEKVLTFTTGLKLRCWRSLGETAAKPPEELAGSEADFSIALTRPILTTLFEVP